MQIINRVSSSLPDLFVARSSSRALVPYGKTMDMVPVHSLSDGPEQDSDPYHSLSGDAANLLYPRYASPIQLTEASLDLYAMGLISFEDYSALANHPELHPNFNNTIGALTGETAAPERKRDMVTEWEERYRFLYKFSPENTQLINQAARITNLLRALARKTNLQM